MEALITKIAQYKDMRLPRIQSNIYLLAQAAPSRLYLGCYLSILEHVDAPHMLCIALNCIGMERRVIGHFALTK